MVSSVAVYVSEIRLAMQYDILDSCCDIKFLSKNRVDRGLSSLQLFRLCLERESRAPVRALQKWHTRYTPIFRDKLVFLAVLLAFSCYN